MLYPSLSALLYYKRYQSLKSKNDQLTFAIILTAKTEPPSSQKKVLNVGLREWLGQMNLWFVTCQGWDGATNDVGAPENRMNVLTPGPMTSYPVFGPVVTVHPSSKKIRVILLYLELLPVRNGW
jgi:hypothetical protein